MNRPLEDLKHEHRLIERVLTVLPGIVARLRALAGTG